MKEFNEPSSKTTDLCRVARTGIEESSQAAMLVAYLRSITGKNRTLITNRHLAFVLSAIAGAVNAGGFVAVGQFTSHMSGILSQMAEDLATGAVGLLVVGATSIFFFISGAVYSAMLVNWARKRRMEAEYAMPLIVEAILLLLFALLGGNITRIEWLFVPVTVMLLCFIMGLQNAICTQLSHAEIRTTHVTGMVTDIGIELGKALYWNRNHHSGMRVYANSAKLKNLTTLVLLFYAGGVVGALGFRHFGFVFTLPLAATLIVIALVPVLDDVRRTWQQRL
jgi:uncharacterized membrane protein YoaK (UPF0700 family)